MASPTSGVTQTPEPAGAGGDPRDGRTARAQCTRDRVVNAVLDLVREGKARPTAREIADRAGISLRSVYVHFDDLDDLFRAAAQRQVESLSEFLSPIDADLPLHERIAAFAAQRAAIFEHGGAVTEAAALWAPRSAALREVLARGQRAGYRDIERLFAADVPPGEEGALVLEAINALASNACWGVWRRQRRLGTKDAREVMRVTVARLLGQAP